MFIFKEDSLLIEGSIYHLKELIQYCTVLSSLRIADCCYDSGKDNYKNS